MFTHTCEMCGMEFQSPSNRAKYCIYCRDKAQVLRNKAYKEKKLAGLSVTIGSEQICPFCNKAYTVTSGSQKCCKDCQSKQNSKKKSSSNKRFTAKNYDKITFYVHKGEQETIKAYAKSLGLSVNKLLQTALDEYKKNHNES